MRMIALLRWLVAGFCVLVFMAMVVSEQSYAADTVDQKCMKDAATERTNRLKKAYEDFAKDMKDAADKLRDDEASRLSFGDLHYSQSEIARSYANYSYEVSERSRDLSAKTTDAWNDYQNRRSKCNVSAIPGTQTPMYYPPSTGLPSYGYGYPSGGYGGYSSYSYPYYYGTNGRNPYGYGTYGYGGDIYRGCSERTLSAPPPGCGYSYGLDSNGCPSYTPICSNALSTTTSCTCSSQYAPVCSKDGRTFFNACYAACMGATVQFQGSCLQY